MFCSVDTFIGMRCTTANHLTYLMVVYSAMEFILQKKNLSGKSASFFKEWSNKSLTQTADFFVKTISCSKY